MILSGIMSSSISKFLYSLTNDLMMSIGLFRSVLAALSNFVFHQIQDIHNLWYFNMFVIVKMIHDQKVSFMHVSSQ